MISGASRLFWICFTCLSLCLATGTVRATTFLTLESTYLGDGWFQYQMNVMNDPFFSGAEVSQLTIPFTNQIDQVTPTNGWSYQPAMGWEYSSNYPARPYSETFLARSSETSFRLAPMTNWLGAAVALSLHLSGDYPGIAEGLYSEDILGIASMPCLVPCRPEDADGSPTNYLYSLKLLPDINLNGLIQTNGNIYGVDFAWDSPATFLLQGSMDMKSWTNINYLWSNPPEEAWTTNVSLSSYGSFFRVELVADGHQTNLPPLSSAGAMPAPNARLAAIGKFATGPNITNCRPAGGKIAVSVSAQAGQTVQVQALTPSGAVVQSQSVVASTSSVTVNFDAAGLPNAVMFRAALAPKRGQTIEKGKYNFLWRGYVFGNGEKWPYLRLAKSQKQKWK